MPNTTTPAPDAGRNPLRKIDDAVIAPKPTRKLRARVFQVYVLLAAVLFVALAVTARVFGYFPIDLTITLAVQRYHGAAFASVMHWVSWIGFMPQVIAICGAGVIGLFLLGMRWEAVALLFASVANALGALVKLIVLRPRPTPDLVHVIAELNSPGFPSGHVLSVTAYGGFIIFLLYTLLKHSPWRTSGITVLSVLIGLMGISRIYQGQHWFSDVMGAYLLGSVWLALTIRGYRWGKTRYFVRQPVAPETHTPAVAPVGRAS